MFGLSFVNPFLLIGSVIGAAPIIIHLLHRRRFHVVRWAAVRFLLASMKKNNRRIRLEHLILLIIRTLILVLAAMAIAQPVLRSAGLVAAAVARPNRHVILLLDNSFSMAQQTGSTSAFEQAIAVGRQIIDSLRDGDKISFYVFSDRPEGIVKEPSYNLKSVKAELEAAEVSHSTTDVPGILREAGSVVAKSSGPGTDLFLITDLQLNGWGLGISEKDPEFQKALKELGETANVFLVDVGQPESGNSAVTGITVSPQTVLVGDITSFETTVRNLSDRDASKVVVNFYVDNRKQGTKSVAVSGRSEASLRFNHVFRDRVPHIMRVELEPDGLPLDDVRYVCVSAQDAVPVLCIDGKPGNAPGLGKSRFLEAALAPRLGEGFSSVISPKVLSPFSVRPSTFTDFQVVILADVSILTDEAVEALELYVREGGALVVFVGENVDARFYNERLYRGGQGLLPAALRTPVSPGTDSQGPFFFEPRSYSHPMLAMFKGLKATPLTSAIVQKHFGVSVPAGDVDTQVICPFNTGLPAIIEKPVGLGRTVLFTTTCNTEWTNLPKKPVFLPLLHETVLYLIHGVDPTRDLEVGDSFRRILRPVEYGDRFTISRTLQTLSDRTKTAGVAEDAIQVAGTPFGKAMVLVFEGTRRAGVYEVKSSRHGKEAQYFCVNPKPVESDLRRTSPEVLQNAFPDFDFRYARGGTELDLSEGEGDAVARALWKAALWLVLGLLCIESLLAHRFGK